MITPSVATSARLAAVDADVSATREDELVGALSGDVIGLPQDDNLTSRTIRTVSSFRKSMRCPNCGAPRNGYVCRYCKQPFSPVGLPIPTGSDGRGVAGTTSASAVAFPPPRDLVADPSMISSVWK